MTTRTGPTALVSWLEYRREVASVSTHTGCRPAPDPKITTVGRTAARIGAIDGTNRLIPPIRRGFGPSMAKRTNRTAMSDAKAPPIKTIVTAAARNSFILRPT